MAYDHLMHEIRFTFRYLRWVPHLLSEADKHARAQLSFGLFEMFRHQKDRAWHEVGTLDESWFYLTTDCGQIWLPEGTEAPERERITAQSREIMVTIVWKHTGLYRIVALPKGMKFNADYSSLRDLIHSPSGEGARSGARIEDRMSARTILALTLRSSY
jgi:hypothetical protein